MTEEILEDEWPAPCVLDITDVNIPIGASVYGLGLDKVKIHVSRKVLAQYQLVLGKKENSKERYLI